MPDVEGYPWPEAARWIRASMVMSLDGSMVDSHGLSRGLSTPEDQDLFRALRRDADVILVGAGTVRAERYHVQHRPIAIVSNSGQLPADLPMLDWRAREAHRPLLYTTESAIGEGDIDDRVEAVACGQEAVDLLLLAADLEKRGWRRVTCEGGPTLLRALLEAGLLDEMCLSIVATLAGTARPILELGSAPRRLHLTSVSSAGRTVFLRLLVRDEVPGIA